MLKFFKRKKESSNSPQKNKQAFREKKWERWQKKRLRWAVLRHYVLHYELDCAENIYEIKKICSQLKSIINIVDDVKDCYLETVDFEVLQRFIRKEQFLDKCQYVGCPNISYVDSPNISLEDYLKTKTIDPEKSYLKACDYYESYWDEVLNNYKRVSDKRKRLNNLLENLREFLEDPDLNNDNVQSRIKGLIKKYTMYLDSIS